MSEIIQPVLPWANSSVTDQVIDKPEAGTHEEDEQIVGLNLQEVGLEEGKKIQVRWEVDITTEHGDTGEKETKHMTKWWPAKVGGPVDLACSRQGEGTGPAAPAAPPSAQPAYHLLYEQFETFNEECCRVMFTSPHCLVDVTDADQPNHLIWRHEGDNKEYGFADEEEEEEEEEIDGDRSYTADELVEMMASRRGAEESNADKLLDTLEPHQQREVAAHYRDFIDGFKEFLTSKYGAQGGATVTAEDVHGYTNQLHKKRRQA